MKTKCTLARVCILGASKGLGSELARILAGNAKYKSSHLLIAARSGAQLQQLKNSLQEIFQQRKIEDEFFSIEVLECDVTKKQGQELLAEALQTQNIDTVLNCVGTGNIQSFLSSSFELNSQQIQLNVEALTNTSQTVAKYFAKAQKDDSKSSNVRFSKETPSIANLKTLLHVSSIAAFSPLPNMAVYAATKIYGFNLSLALDKEFESIGAQCVVVCPGPLNTTLFDWSKTGFLSSSQVQSPSACAKQIMDDMLKGKKIIVTGFSNKAFFALSEVLPSQLKKTIANFYLNYGDKKS